LARETEFPLSRWFEFIERLAYSQGELFNTPWHATSSRKGISVMRLATLSVQGQPRPFILAGNDLVDLLDADSSLPASVRALLEAGPDAMAAAQRAGASPKARRIPVSQGSFLSPVHDPKKITCLGQNYSDHAKETGSPIPKEPVLFSKYATALTGHNCQIELPSVSQEVDFEAELVIVIGKRGRHIRPENAFDYVAGYTVGHDVSARDWQLRKDGKQWMAGKTFDTFAPNGPFLVTKDEVPDPRNLKISLKLNGQVMQNSTTHNMIFGVPEILPYISTIFTVEPGDLIYTGTPPGVGMARKPPVYLKPGDVTEVEIEGLGVLRNPVVQGK
jgi:2-keto-4-pentenoate hydratase/2-oxohepta-3-ene-1,7-dioic acid hydratase in catechol pathway